MDWDGIKQHKEWVRIKGDRDMGGSYEEENSSMGKERGS